MVLLLHSTVVDKLIKGSRRVHDEWLAAGSSK